MMNLRGWNLVEEGQRVNEEEEADEEGDMEMSISL